MASKSVNGLSIGHKCDREMTDRPRHGEMCSYRRNCFGYSNST